MFVTRLTGALGLSALMGTTTAIMAQSLPEPAGMPVYRTTNPRNQHNPFSPRYLGAWNNYREWEARKLASDQDSASNVRPVPTHYPVVPAAPTKLARTPNPSPLSPPSAAPVVAGAPHQPAPTIAHSKPAATPRATEETVAPSLTAIPSTTAALASVPTVAPTQTTLVNTTPVIAAPTRPVVPKVVAPPAQSAPAPVVPVTKATPPTAPAARTTVTSSSMRETPAPRRSTNDATRRTVSSTNSESLAKSEQVAAPVVKPSAKPVVKPAAKTEHVVKADPVVNSESNKASSAPRTTTSSRVSKDDSVRSNTRVIASEPKRGWSLNPFRRKHTETVVKTTSAPATRSTVVPPTKSVAPTKNVAATQASPNEIIVGEPIKTPKMSAEDERIIKELGLPPGSYIVKKEEISLGSQATANTSPSTMTTHQVAKPNVVAPSAPNPSNVVRPSAPARSRTTSTTSTTTTKTPSPVYVPALPARAPTKSEAE